MNLKKSPKSLSFLIKKNFGVVVNKCRNEEITIFLRIFSKHIPHLTTKDKKRQHTLKK